MFVRHYRKMLPPVLYIVRNGSFLLLLCVCVHMYMCVCACLHITHCLWYLFESPCEVQSYSMCYNFHLNSKSEWDILIAPPPF